jgi:DNA-binding LytR/AlgR family response regulator
MIRCIIIDDEPLALEVLEAHIGRSPQLTLVRKCRNALEAYEVLQTEKVDLMFLDIRMPSISGIELIRSLRHPPGRHFYDRFCGICHHRFRARCRGLSVEARDLSAIRKEYA